MELVKTMPFGNAEAAQSLREMADKVERGDIRDWFFAADDLSEGAYYSHSNFQDKWRLLGALEFAKSRVATDGE